MTAIQPGQEYESCHPLDNIRIRIESISGNGTHAWVIDAVTRKRPRKVALKSLHPTGTTRDGQPRRTGYRLVRHADGSPA